MKTGSLCALGFCSLLAFTGCGPGSEKKDKEPPKPKVVGVVEKLATPLPVLGAAPQWKLQDLNGKLLSAADLKGKVVVVDFWATWCGPCRAEIPGYIELQKKYEKDGLVIVGVSLDQAGVDIVKNFAVKMAINYPLVMGDDDVQAAFGGLQVIPTTFLIDREGRIRDKKEGVEEAASYERKIVSLLSGT